ncbi:MAG: hypothetical protein FWD82_05345 [Defluviitaleaceae bacterium]|nr:hypothetical protein [Defluviitaleaceae bacterium]
MNNKIDNLLKNHFSEKFSPSNEVKSRIRQKLLEKAIKKDTRICVLATIFTTIIGFMIVFGMHLFLANTIVTFWTLMFFASSVLSSLIITIFNQLKLKKGEIRDVVFCI